MANCIIGKVFWTEGLMIIQASLLSSIFPNIIITPYPTGLGVKLRAILLVFAKATQILVELQEASRMAVRSFMMIENIFRTCPGSVETIESHYF